jgi:inorganic phosphate transporter, PiT family
MSEVQTLVLIIGLAVAFDFINGFHDSANAIATVIATRVLSPAQAILMAAALNFGGAVTGTAVAKTVGSGLIDPAKVTLHAVTAALVAAIGWNLITWYRGIPSSSSHALIGGIIGAGIAQSGMAAPNWPTVFKSVILPFLISPFIGFLFSALILIATLRLFGRWHPRSIRSVFGRLQLFSSALMAYSHGGNDAQKTMGIITLALVASGMQPTFEVPLWVILTAGTAMALGTAAGGWRIIRTLSTKMGNLKPIDGFAAETAAASVIELASRFGFPLSTTHVITSAILGAGVTRQPGQVRWVVAGNIVTAWIVTLPFSALASYLIYWALNLFFVR